MAGALRWRHGLPNSPGVCEVRMYKNSERINGGAAFHATGAKTFTPFYYGKFHLADKPIGEPEQICFMLPGPYMLRLNLLEGILRPILPPI